MLTQFYFYFHQGRTAVRKSILTLIALALAISLITGVNFYVDSYQSQMLDESFTQMFDYSLTQYGISTTSNAFFEENTREKWLETLNTYDLTPDEFFPHIQVDSDWYFKSFINEDSTSSVDYFIVPSDFYTSERFADYYIIREGSYPKTDSEVLIHEDLAHYLSLSIGDTWGIFYNNSAYLGYHYNSTFEYNLNFTVAGTYLPIYESTLLGNEHYWTFTFYDPVSQTVTHRSTSNAYDRESLIFSSLTKNISTQGYNQHPVQAMITYWNDQLSSMEYPPIESTSGYHYGYQACLDRSKISFNNLMSSTRGFEKSVNLFYQDYSSLIDQYSDFWFNFYLNDQIANFIQEIRILRIVLQIFNVPIILCAFYIAFFSVRMNTKERQNEFLLLRSKGISRKMIRWQFISQSIMLGIVCGAIGIFGGMGLFHIVKNFFFEFFGEILTHTLHLHISLFSILYNFLIGIVLMLVSAIPSIKFINKKETNQLLSTLGSEYLDVEYDEQTLFFGRPKKEVTLEDTPFLRAKGQQPTALMKNSTFSDQVSSSTPIISQKEVSPKIPRKNQTKRAKKKSNVKVYQNQLKKKERKIRKYGIYLIIFSMIPVFIYFIYLLSLLPFAPDSIILFVENRLLPNYEYVYIFAVFSPIFLVIGLIRYFVKENPSRFARLVKTLAHPFVKGKDFLISLNMVKQKAYIRFMMICGLFCSLFIFSNITLYTTQARDILESNFKTGADVDIRLSRNAFFDASALLNSSEPLSPHEINWRDSLFAESLDETNHTFINNAATYISLEQQSWSESFVESHIFMDIPKYIDMIREQEKRMPNKDFASILTQIENYYQDSSQNLSGILVSDDFEDVYHKTVGDTVTIINQYYDPLNDTVIDLPVQVKIVGVLPFFPGVFDGARSWYRNSVGIMMNLSIFPTIAGNFGFDSWVEDEYNSYNENSQYVNVGQLLDVDPKMIANQTHLRACLDSLQFDWHDVYEYNFYQDDILADPRENSDFSDGPTATTFYNLIYLEFFIIGGILAITLALITVSIQRQNKYVNGVYLSRGIGWKGLLTLIITQVTIIFLIALGFGIIGGASSSIIILQTMQRTQVYLPGVELPIFCKFWDCVWLLGGIVLLTYITYFTVFYFETKKNIRDYFPQF